MTFYLHVSKFMSIVANFLLACKVISVVFNLLTLLSNSSFFVEIKPFNLNHIHKPRIFPLIEKVDEFRGFVDFLSVKPLTCYNGSSSWKSSLFGQLKAGH